MSSCLFGNTVQQQESVGVCAVRYGCRWGSWVVQHPPAGRLSRMWEWGAMMGVAAQSCWDDTSVDTPCHLSNDMPNSWLHSYNGPQVTPYIVNGQHSLMRDFDPVIEIRFIEWHPALSLATVTNSP